jgi:hypothetical protein
MSQLEDKDITWHLASAPNRFVYTFHTNSPVIDDGVFNKNSRAPIASRLVEEEQTKIIVSSDIPRAYVYTPEDQYLNIYFPHPRSPESLINNWMTGDSIASPDEHDLVSMLYIGDELESIRFGEVFMEGIINGKSRQIESPFIWVRNEVEDGISTPYIHTDREDYSMIGISGSSQEISHTIFRPNGIDEFLVTAKVEKGFLVAKQEFVTTGGDWTGLFRTGRAPIKLPPGFRRALTNFVSLPEEGGVVDVPWCDQIQGLGAEVGVGGPNIRKFLLGKLENLN